MLFRSVESGNVISCDPGVGTSVEEGTAIGLVVSQGPDPSLGTGTDDGTDPDIWTGTESTELFE